VLRRFVRVSPVLNLHVGGRLIGTTAEHPFYVADRGWLPAAELRIGDWVVAERGDPIRVEGIADSGRVETVYNLEVEDDHTYFVGEESWGFAVWAHNAYAKRMSGSAKAAKARQYADDVKAGRATDWGNLTPKQQRAIKEYAVNKGMIDGKLLHGNSHSVATPAVGYKLVDRTTGEILKFGETTLPGSTRYSQKYLKKINAEFVPMTQGTKAQMHAWQHNKIMKFQKLHNRRPRLNFSDY
jgi:hypothetical protein